MNSDVITIIIILISECLSPCDRPQLRGASDGYPNRCRHLASTITIKQKGNQRAACRAYTPVGGNPRCSMQGPLWSCGQPLANQTLSVPGAARSEGPALPKHATHRNSIRARAGHLNATAQLHLSLKM